MKSFNNSLGFFSLILLTVCVNLHAQDTDQKDSEAEVQEFGEIFTAEELKSEELALDFYRSLKDDTTEEISLKGEISSVCQVKGCWMVLQLEEGEQVMVTFKDYGFFVPSDITGNTAVVKGIASVKTTSEEDRRHFARDAGKSEKEVEQIKGAANSYSLIASGVKIIDQNGAEDR